MKMKLSRFFVGLVTGVLLSLNVAACVFYLFTFPVRDGFYESPTIPFIVTEDHPKYSIYKELESEEYWQKLSESAESVVEKYFKQNKITRDINILCIGSPQNYQIYYSTGYSSLHELLTRNKLEAVIVDHVDSHGCPVKLNSDQRILF